MLPHFGDLCEVELGKIFDACKNLITFGVRLQQPVLDAVVHHLHVVAGAGRTDVRVAVLRRERA